MTITIGSLVEALFELYPAEDASEWDACGLRVGDPALEVEGVAVALDVTAAAIDETCRLGANVLLTHHPVFLEPLDTVVAGLDGGGLAFQAASSGVALISMHTNLDRAHEVREKMLSSLGAEFVGPLEGRAQGEDDRDPAFGQIGRFVSHAMPTLSEVAERAADSFGVTPRVWGDPDRRVAMIGTASGSASSLIDDAIAAELDVLVAGEIKYHDIVYAGENGLAILLLGHDGSEEFLADALKGALDRITDVPVHRLEPSTTWWIP